ncbi:IS4 family transposase [Cupriavidus sp. LEh21]|nr:MULTISPECIES: IS4 family transposase [unclassified Cupriavidus]MDK2662175.1 IS4 family transposase [Cupriavidus sp. LEh21]
MTNREAQDTDAVIELVDWYRARWEVEMFFHVLKTGCKLEALQLSHMDRVERALALYMVVAWRIARLMRLGRTCPDLDVSLFFDADEIGGAYVLAKQARPKAPVTLNQMILVGCFPGRVPWAQERWRARRQNDLDRHAANHGCRTHHTGAAGRVITSV